MTNPGSWQFVRKSDVSFDLFSDQSDHDITDCNLGSDNSDDQLGGKLDGVDGDLTFLITILGKPHFKSLPVYLGLARLGEGV